LLPHVSVNIRIIGLGNPLLSDDGFGSYVVRLLDALYEMPPNVAVVDAAIPGVDLAPHVRAADVILLVDAVAGAGAPGDVRATRGVPLAGAEHKDVVLISVVPEWEATGTTLSCPVCSSIHRAIELLLSHLAALGVVPGLRAVPHAPGMWWEREACHPEFRRREDGCRCPVELQKNPQQVGIPQGSGARGTAGARPRTPLSR
jgi:hypothetical protein